MKRMSRMAAFVLLVVVSLVPFNASVASAHGHTEVGDYEIVIGFHNEPAYQGEPNGLNMFVTNKATKAKINGLEDTLKAELIDGDKKVALPVKAQWGQDGAYTAYVIPTETGAYTWHIFGTINTTPVDVSMTAGPEAFSEIESKGAISFPAAEPTAADLTSQIGQARMFGIAGGALGIIGLLVAIAALIGRRTPQVAVGRQQAPSK